MLNVTGLAPLLTLAALAIETALTHCTDRAAQIRAAVAAGSCDFYELESALSNTRIFAAERGWEERGGREVIRTERRGREAERVVHAVVEATLYAVRSAAEAQGIPLFRLPASGPDWAPCWAQS